MRVAFAGSPPAAVPILRALAGSEHEVVMVVTQPDRPRGRGQGALPTPVAATAEELGLPVIRPATINAPEVHEAMADAGVAALCVAAFGQILREPHLSDRPCLNVHFSLLPAYRGAAPVERAMMDGQEETGVTIMRMDAGMDTGPIISMMRLPIGPDDDAGTVTARLADAGAGLLLKALDALEAGRLRSRPQPEEGVSMAPKLTAEDRVLDFSRPAGDLANRVRALSPHIGSVCRIDGQQFKVWRARAVTDDLAEPLSVDGDRLLVRCGEGALEVVELQPPNRGRMPAAAFLRGWRGALELG